MSDPGRRLAELFHAARSFLDLCRTYVPIVGEPTPPGTPGPAWIIPLSVAAGRLARCLDERYRKRDAISKDQEKLQLAHGLAWFVNLFDGLLKRWEWPPRTKAEDWWESFLDALAFTPDDEVRLSSSGWLSFTPISAIPMGERRYRLTPIGQENRPSRQPPRSNLEVYVDHMGWQIHDLGTPGGQTKLVVILTRGDGTPPTDIFALLDPIIPTIRFEELEALEKALVMIEAAVQAGPDPPFHFRASIPSQSEVSPAQLGVASAHSKQAKATVPDSSDLTVEERAIELVVRKSNRGENCSVTSIARELGVNRTYLYELPRFKAMIEATRKMGRPRKGSKDRETGELIVEDD